MLTVREVKKKNQNRKAITGVKWKKTKSKRKRGIAKKQERAAGGTVLELGTVLQEPNFGILNFSSLFALLSFWSLICNVEFDLNSSCLDRLNNFSII